MGTIRGTDQRGSDRVFVQLPVTLAVGRDRDVSMTEEVGFGGVFVSTRGPYALRQLLSLSIELPQGEKLELQGMVVRVVNDDDAGRFGTVPGIGVQFYSLEEVEASQWHAFVAGQIQASEQQDPHGSESSLTVEEIARAAGLDPRIVKPSDLCRPIRIIGPESQDPSRSETPSENDAKSTTLGFRVLDRVDDSKDLGGVQKKLESSPHLVTKGDRGLDQEAGLVTDEPRLPLTDSDRLRRGRPHRDPIRLRQRELPPSIDAPRIDDMNKPLRDRSTHGEGGSRHRRNKPTPLAPNGSLPNVVYKLELATVGDLEEFSHVAFGSGGVSVRTRSLRPAGNPAIVCVVHPVSRQEFHIPGTIVAARNKPPGVSIRFARVTTQTFRDFRRFIAIGRQRPGSSGAHPTDGELTLVSESSISRKVTPNNRGPSDTHPVDLEAVEPLRKD